MTLSTTTPHAPGETRTPNLLIRSHTALSDTGVQPQALTEVTRDSAWPEDATKRPSSAKKYPLTFPQRTTLRRCANCPASFARLKHSRRFLCDACRAVHLRTIRLAINRAYWNRMPTDVRRARYRRQQRMEKARFLRRLLTERQIV